MKILPPLRNWLPALLKSRTAQGLAATILVLAAGLLILLDRDRYARDRRLQRAASQRT